MGQFMNKDNMHLYGPVIQFSNKKSLYKLFK